LPKEEKVIFAETKKEETKKKPDKKRLKINEKERKK